MCADAVQCYSLFGYCLVLLLSHVFSGDSDFYIMLFSIGALSALKLVCPWQRSFFVNAPRSPPRAPRPPTPSKVVVAFIKHRMSRAAGWIVGAILGAVHWLYLWYGAAVRSEAHRPRFTYMKYVRPHEL